MLKVYSHPGPSYSPDARRHAAGPTPPQSPSQQHQPQASGSHSKPATPRNFSTGAIRPSSPMTPKEWRTSVGLTNDVQFVPAKDSSVLGSGIEGKYKALNDSDMELSEDDRDEPPSTPTKPSLKGKEKALSPEESLATPRQSPISQNYPTLSTPPSSAFRSSSSAATSVKRKRQSDTTDLYPPSVSTHWPPDLHLGRGLENTGNTCFLNSVLQCLLYTPPLLHMLFEHDYKSCDVRPFCGVCCLGAVARFNFYGGRGYFNPKPISTNLHRIAKHLRRGRQEDAHEFLRYLIDACQTTCEALLSPKERSNPALVQTSWVHKIFGGKTRSRVTCRRCGYNSDTFEACLDLSLDLSKCATVDQALQAFVREEDLSGQGKDGYKCEKCKIPVDVFKQFTIHSAPLVLTIHLKRFTGAGKKIGRPIEYPETLKLAKYVSEEEYGPTYSLYGIVSHTGSGPHHGHYVAHIKSPTGRWHEMNDEDVSKGSNSPPLGMREAYILFYIQNGDSRLDDAIGVKRPRPRPRRRPFVEDDEEEEEEEGPPRPDDMPPLNVKPIGGPDLARKAAEANAKTTYGMGLSEKIAAHRARESTETTSPSNSAKMASDRRQPVSLVKYGEDEDEEDVGEKVPPLTLTNVSGNGAPRFIGPQLPPSSTEPQPQSQGSNSTQSAKSTILASISGTLDSAVDPASFYGGQPSASSMAHRRRGSSPITTETEESSDSSRRDRKRRMGAGHNWTRDSTDRRRSGLSGNSLGAARETILGSNSAFQNRSKPPGGIKNNMKGRP